MSGEYWRCKRCGVVLPNTEQLPRFPCPWCGGGEGFEPVAVLPVAELARLQGIEARLRNDALIEKHYSLIDELFSADDYRRAVLGEAP